MKLLKIAHIPPATTTPETTVLEAVQTMARNRVGAVAVLDIPGSGALVGVFTERDLMLRVVLSGLDPRTTKIREVMTTEVKAASEETGAAEALSLMLSGHLRHLPILGSDRHVLGILSIRNLLENKVEQLIRSLDSMEQYLTND